MKSRTCKKCGETYPISRFGMNRGYYRRTCTNCTTETAAQKRQRDRHRAMNAAVALFDRRQKQ